MATKEKSDKEKSEDKAEYKDQLKWVTWFLVIIIAVWLFLSFVFFSQDTGDSISNTTSEVGDGIANLF